MDWVERVAEVQHHLGSAYQISDGEAVEVLLAGLIAVPRTAPVWLIVESNWYSRSCESAWFALGGAWTPNSLGELRSMRPRRAREEINGWLSEPPTGRLFVEADWERLPRYGRIPESRHLLNRSLRVRVKTPRTVGVLAVDARDEERRRARLRALVQGVIEDRIGARSAEPPVFSPPANWLYHAELLHRASPWYEDWGEMLNALAAVSVHHAYLYGRGETTEADWAIVARVVRDSIPPWVQRAVCYLAEEPAGAGERAMSGGVE
jgi:hypothetical protein